MKLWAKLGISFGLVIAVMVVLSLYVMFGLAGVRSGSETIAKHYMPEVRDIVGIERMVLAFVSEMNQYIATRDNRQWKEVWDKLQNVSAYFKKASATAAGAKVLAELAQGLATAESALSAYIQACGNTHDIMEEMSGAFGRMEKAISAFTSSLSIFVSEQEYMVMDDTVRRQGNFGAMLDQLNRAHNVMMLNNELRFQFTQALSLDKPDTAEKSMKNFPTVIAMTEKLAGDVMDKEQKELVNDAGVAAKNFFENGNAYIKLWRERHRADADRSAQQNRLIDATRLVSTFGIDSTMTLSGNAANTSLQLSLHLQIGLLAAVLIAAVFAILLTRSITRPLQHGVSFAADLAAGQLDKTLDIVSRDEIGALASALNSMVATLRQKIEESDKSAKQAQLSENEAREAMAEAEQARHFADNAKKATLLQAASHLEEVVTVLSSASNALLAIIGAANQGAGAQADKMGGAAKDVERMTSSIAEVARNATTAAEVADNSKDKASEGASIVRQVIDEINAVRKQSESLRLDMEALGGKTDSISQILDVISDIADQTNLLALNAAIEAARAGEAGRGFAVVADEVRKLAEKTMQATHQVGATIKDIQLATRKNVISVDETVQTIENVSKLTLRSGDELDEIVRLAENSSAQIRVIATASEGQSSFSAAINASIEQVSQIARGSAQSMREAERAVADLAEQTNSLSGLIASMKTGEGS
jgi:methyl-accepting chemotaxis protein